MITVANRSDRPQILPQKGKDAVEILPGETAKVEIDADNPHVAAKVRAGLIEIATTKEETKALIASTSTDAASKSDTKASAA
ncbi:hypothetical protein [Aureimonas sp. AU12]|uniref:hypothetical protein n=1 Tax=Aureimonas sp. AU12 TaxID=1638161 RepID=UPI000784E9A5|nr:hypothetical protein [Aureimonas sp. AU12]